MGPLCKRLSRLCPLKIKGAGLVCGMPSLSHADAIALAASLCDRDRREILALQEVDDLDCWAAGMVQLCSDSARCAADVIRVDGKPIAVAGIVRSNQMPWHASSFLFGSDERFSVWDKCLRVLMRAKRTMVNSGVRHITMLCLDGPEPTAWLERLGFNLIGKSEGYGRDGETFCLWSMTCVRE